MIPGNAEDSVVACSEFLALYGDYADGLLDGQEAERMKMHAAACSPCARYGRIIERGAELARDIMVVEPSSDFEERLQHRIFHEQDAATLQPVRPVGVPAALAVAAVIALLAWSPMLMDGDASPETALLTAHSAPLPGTSGFAPFTGGSTWYPVQTTSSNVILAAFPGPHSPLIVTPPAHRRVRTVSAEYAPVE